MKYLIVALLLASANTDASDCRSVSSRNEFWKQSGYAKGRSGWWVDHVCPLECGGKYSPINMQWQTAVDARAKDKWERKKCVELCNSTNSTYPTRTVFNCKRG